MTNYKAPFDHEGETSLVGWIANTAAAENGNVKNDPGRGIDWMLDINSWGVDVIDGLLYQVVDLEAGTYKIDAYIFHAATCCDGHLNFDLAAALGDTGLPFSEGSLGNVLDAATIPEVPVGTQDNEYWWDSEFIWDGAPPMVSIEFELSAAGKVSLGFYGKLQMAEFQINKIVLWRLQ